MRIRTIKPEFYRSADIADLCIEDRLLFIGIWSYVDDNGVGRDEEDLIVIDLFPKDYFREPAATLARVATGLARLADAGLVVRYVVDGRGYLQVTNWGRHQKIDRPNKPRYPRSDADGAELATTLASVATIPSWGTEEQRIRGTEEQSLLVIPDGTTERASSTSKSFDQWWEHWPKKVRKKQARDAFPAALKLLPLPALIEATDRWVTAFNATGNDRKFIPDPDRWLKHQRWEDDLGPSQAPRLDPLKDW